MSQERNFPLSKDVLDTTNSAAWFFMDACWMLGFREVALLLTLPTVLSALCLCYVEKRATITLINLAILSWVTMNVSWMFSDLLGDPGYLVVAKSCFVTGVVLIGLALVRSRNLVETFSHFKRFRLKGLKF